MFWSARFWVGCVRLPGPRCYPICHPAAGISDSGFTAVLQAKPAVILLHWPTPGNCSRSLNWKQRLRRSPQEQEVMRVYAPAGGRRCRQTAEHSSGHAKRAPTLAGPIAKKIQASNAEATSLFALSRSFEQLPRTESEARQSWQESYQTNRKRSEPLGSIVPTADAGSDRNDGPGWSGFALFRRNVCSHVLPVPRNTGATAFAHAVFTTPSAAATRTSVAWTTFCCCTLYLYLADGGSCQIRSNEPPCRHTV